jgi:outer membrane lipoprotein SlyB
MGLRRIGAPCLLLLVLSGCATLPTGPSVKVLPAQGKSFDTFRSEDATCRQWAEQGRPAQETYDQNVATGAVAGTAVGAGLGAALGSASGHAGAGALIGAAGGLLIGSAAGSDSGQVYGREAQRRYDNAYIQCMYSYGNQVPGVRRVAAAPPRTVVAAAPPPPPPAPMAAPAPAYDPGPPPDFMPEPEQFPRPAEVYVSEAPQFLFSPTLNMYVAVGVPYDLMYNGTDFFYFYSGRWYRGPYYNGPWSPLRRRYYPPALLRYRIGNIRHFRELEYRRFDRDRGHYDGRMHRPVFRGEIR